MPVEINWSLARSGEGGAMAAFKQGRELGSDIRRSQALRAYAKNPQDPEVLNALVAVAPELGFKAAEFQRESVKDKREQEYSAAAGDYFTKGGGNALLMAGRQSTAPAPAPAPAMAVNVLALGAVPQPLQGASLGQAAQAPMGPVPDLPDSRQKEPDPDLAILGAPKTGQDRAFLRMIKAVPVKALKLRSELRDNFVKTLKDTREVYRFGIERLSLASDEQTYQSVLAEMEPMTQAIGGNLLNHVPANYPGPEGMRELLTKALDAKEQVSAFMQQANIDDDNERADRNTDSIIADRSARQGEVRRYHDQQSGNTRRGQDVRSRDARRGQDRRGSGRSGLVTVKSRAEAEALPSGTKFRDPSGVVRTRP